jgi:hypothetical protein
LLLLLLLYCCRGNLGLDCLPEKMALVQKTLIQSCNLVRGHTGGGCCCCYCCTVFAVMMMSYAGIAAECDLAMLHTCQGIDESTNDVHISDMSAAAAAVGGQACAYHARG